MCAKVLKDKKMPVTVRSFSRAIDAPKKAGQKKKLQKRTVTKTYTRSQKDDWEAMPQGSLRLMRKTLKSLGRPSMQTGMRAPKPAKKAAQDTVEILAETRTLTQASVAPADARKVGLMNFPQPSAQESLEIDALGLITKALDGEAILQPPGLPILVAIDSQCDPKMAYQLATGNYELDETTLIQRHVRPGQKVLDIGACVGVTTALCGAITKKPVVAIEPNSWLHDIIRTQASINGLTVKVEQCCVGPHDGKNVSFQVHRQPWRSALERYTNVDQDYRLEKTRMHSLARILNRHRPDVVLLDVEGAEQGLFCEPLQHKPSLLIVEIHNFYIGETACCEVVQQIIDQNYRLVDRMGWNWVFRLAGDCP